MSSRSLPPQGRRAHPRDAQNRHHLHQARHVLPRRRPLRQANGRRLGAFSRSLFTFLVFSALMPFPQLVDDLSATLHVRRSELNVVATAKGLFAGAVKLALTDGSELSSADQVRLLAALHLELLKLTLVPCRARSSRLVPPSTASSSARSSGCSSSRRMCVDLPHRGCSGSP